MGKLSMRESQEGKTSTQKDSNLKFPKLHQKSSEGKRRGHNANIKRMIDRWVGESRVTESPVAGRMDSIEDEERKKWHNKGIIRCGKSTRLTDGGRSQRSQMESALTATRGGDSQDNQERSKTTCSAARVAEATGTPTACAARQRSRPRSPLSFSRRVKLLRVICSRRRAQPKKEQTALPGGGGRAGGEDEGGVRSGEHETHLANNCTFLSVVNGPKHHLRVVFSALRSVVA